MKQLLLLLFPWILFAQVGLDRAQKMLDNKQYAQAKPVLQTLLKSDPYNVVVIAALGDVAGYYKAWPEAIDYYKRAKNLRPNVADYHYKYGGATGMHALEVNKFKALGMIEEIKTSFEKAIALNPKHIDARWALIELYLKLPRIVGGSEVKAIQYSKELAAITAVDGYMSRGRIEEYYQRYKTAEIAYKNAVVASNNSVKSCQMLASLYKNKMNEPAKAASILEQIKTNN
ncbi:tetratricopeptide repeat protein [Flavobacterium crassostreae]|uniref:Uncharacterized protein n=1 Tax=Flavobacterium crassostreae TaxID=1763534 RepID=A0A1B9E3W1_9FLAO|nr:hypothetical protein [Flavobacterium crassostreae]OCB76626.1 hypothetical protein LPBF_06755 [Flavobacterium crassostreae]